MKFYQVHGPKIWGDYGTVLIAGICHNLGRSESGCLKLARTGPFVPPISFPYGAVIVTDHMRKLLSSSELAGLEFAPVIKAHIAECQWHTWAPDRELPEYPDSGEPEDFVLRRPHSAELAEGLGDLWEIRLPKDAEVDSTPRSGMAGFHVVVNERKWEGSHFFRYGRRVLVTDAGRKWLDSRAGEWVRFKELAVENR